ncbi:hypothetical protein [Leifsonia shinshuensis]|uniref:Uncharacterized protein n=1 Tax=Leifsonia shinshuensis TaxID=150026 RepID=A0A853CX03_9MICO|nr:hypothetical protein [Leifsonia shinshuensis]NYJ24453.1 hypothetical protein [Leifsonia shinshuensis]
MPNDLYPERPWENRPASPGLPPKAPLAPQRKRHTGIWVTFAVAAVLMVVLVVAFGRAKPAIDAGPQTIAAADSISAECEAAAAKADAVLTQLYAAGGPDDKLNDAALSVKTPEQQAEYDAARKAVEDADAAAVLPTFDSCKTASEWLGAAKKHLALAQVTSPDAVTDLTIASLCGFPGASAKPACVDAAALGVT